MSLSLLEQLQLLQMLGSSGANSIAGLSELIAAGGLSSAASSENLAQILKGAAVAGAGGSPSKAEQVNK